MSPSFLKKLFSKLAILSLVITLVAPFAPVAQAANGTLIVSTNNDLATFQVFLAGDQSPILSGSGRGPVNFPLNQGLYDLRFGMVSGFNKPADVTNIVVVSGGVVQLPQSLYTVSGGVTGTLRVTTNNDQANWQIFAAGDRATVIATGTGRGPVSHPLNQGLYDVVFGAVTGFNKPADANNNIVIAGSNSDLGAPLTDYTAVGSITGTLRVRTNNDLGNWKIYAAGDRATVLASGSGQGPMSFPLNQGLYDVVYGDIPGGFFIKPADANNAIVVSGATSDVTGNYNTIPQTGSIAVQVVKRENNVDTPITNGDWTVKSCTTSALSSCTGPVGNGAASTTMTNVATGIYGITANIGSYDSVLSRM